MTKKNYPYKLATLYDAGGDLSKRWRVTFYVWDTRTHRLVRKQKWISNNFKTKAQRLNQANRLIKEINRLLIEGYHLGETTAIKNSSSGLITWIDAWELAADRKKVQVRVRAIKMMEFLIHQLKVFLSKKNQESIPLQFVDRPLVDEFLAFLYDRKVSNTTKNMYIRFTKLLFNDLVNAEIISASPTKGIKLFSTDQVNQQAFQKDLQSKLLERYAQECPEILPLVQFMYYSFIRPGELLQLQVKHIQERTIFVPGHISKNKKSEHVLISPALERLIEKNKIRQAPEHYYIISHDGLPGVKRPCKHYFSNRHLQIRKDLKLSKEYTLYCWKHTGVTDTYRQTRDIEFVSRQCRHSSLDMTKRYLRGLGLLLEYPDQGELPDLGL